MNLASALKELGASGDHVPVEALTWVSHNWAAVAPAARQVLARCTRDPENVPDRDAATAYFLLHAGAEHKDASLIPAFTALARSPEAIDLLFGVTAPLTMTPVIISLFASDTPALLALADAEATDFQVRSCAFEALAWCAASGFVDRAPVLAVLQRYHDEHLGGEEIDWMGWAVAVALLHDEAQLAMLKKACEADLIPKDLLDWVDLDRLAGIARDEGAGMGAFDAEGIHPFGNVVEELLKVQELLDEDDEDFDEEDESGTEESLGAPAPDTATNKFRDVGRNDPCPCGSGLKFKKCCIDKSPDKAA
jgi:uncharacterized protein